MSGLGSMPGVSFNVRYKNGGVSNENTEKNKYIVTVVSDSIWFCVYTLFSYFFYVCLMPMSLWDRDLFKAIDLWNVGVPEVVEYCSIYLMLSKLNNGSGLGSFLQTA